MKNANNIYQKIRLAISILILSLGCAQIHAQQAINASGGDGTGVGSFSYSIGIVVYTSVESISDDASVIQGVQVPFEVFEVASCPTDFNIDGITNGLDFVIFLGNYNTSCIMPPCPTDLNADGDTDGLDFVIFLGNFGVTCN